MCDLGPEFCLFLSSPKAGIFCFVLVLVSCFLSPPCVLAGTHFCGFWPKGMFWSCQEGRRHGLANPRMKVLHLPPPLITVLGAERSYLARTLLPRLMCHEFAQCHH